VEDGGDRARTRSVEARLPRHRRAAVALPEAQQHDGREEALLVAGVTSGSPAASAGVLVGDVLLEFDGHAVESPEDLLDLLVGDRVGRQVPLHVLRGGQAVALVVTVGERPAS